jgi:hypothetical protein
MLRFRLRTLLIAVAMLAVLLTQYPFVRRQPLDNGARFLVNLDGSLPPEAYEENRPLVLTTGFMIAVATEVIAIGAWCLWRRRSRPR